MKDFFKGIKPLEIIGFIIFTCLFVASLIGKYTFDNETLRSICEILLPSSAALDLAITIHVTVSVKITFNKKVENIKNECKLEIEQNIKQEFTEEIKNYKTQIAVLKQRITNYNTTNIINGQKKTPDDKLFVYVKKVFEPIEDFLINNGGFGAPFIKSIFDEFQSFCQLCTKATYKFIDPDLNAILETIKISSCELSNILDIYTFVLDSNPGMSKFLWLDINNKISYQPDAYSKGKIEECKGKFYKANALLVDIVGNYNRLVNKYNERFQK